MMARMSELATFVEQGWNDHADAPAAVAARLEQGCALLRSDADVSALARLGEHVHGAHLGQWTPGLEFLQRLAGHARRRGLLQPGSPAEADIERHRATLALCRGDADPRTGRSTSDRIRIGALAASNLSLFDAERAQGLLAQALQEAADSGLPDADPMNRTLATCGNNIAAGLEELPERSPAQRALMITGAETARCYWERAGTWLEVERAEYRLAHTFLKAGDLQQARWHATTCLQIVQANGSVPLELYYAWEPMALIDHARGDPAAARAALEAMRAEFPRLAADEQPWCAESLAKVERSLGA